MKRDIHLKWFLPHPVENVWECLTNVEELNKWFMKSDFLPVVGHHFKFISKPRPGFNWDGIVYCEVLKVVPLKTLSYSWKGGPRPGEINLDTVVTWTLEEKNGGTELVLAHTGYKGFKNYISSLIMDKGWDRNVTKKFSKILEEYGNTKK
jgi:uncharacterized protein YndB with AHSA1/START domain